MFIIKSKSFLCGEPLHINQWLSLWKLLILSDFYKWFILVMCILSCLRNEACDCGTQPLVGQRVASSKCVASTRQRLPLPLQSPLWVLSLACNSQSSHLLQPTHRAALGWVASPEKWHAEALPPGNCEGDCTWRQESLQMEPRWGQPGGSWSNTTGVLEKWGQVERGADTHRGKMGWRWRRYHRGRDWSDASTSQGHRGLLGGILLESRQRKWVPRKPDFGLSTSRAERRHISAVSSHPGHRTWLQQPEKATRSAPGDSVHADLSSTASCHPPQVVVRLNFLEAPPPQDGTTLCLHAPSSGLFSGPVLTKVIVLWLPGTVALKFLWCPVTAGIYVCLPH